MEKIKIDLVIDGRLISEGKIIQQMGGIYVSSHEDYFDVTDAVIIRGDLTVFSFTNGNKNVLIKGGCVQKGGCYGAL